MIDHSAALINELQRHGITISVDDIPGILRSGIDTLLDRHGLELKAEDTTVLHLILHSIRERDPPGRGGVPKRNIDPLSQTVPPAKKPLCDFPRWGV